MLATQVRHLEAIIRIAEAFCKMRLSEYCTSQDVDRAIAVTVDSFVGAQKVSCRKALGRAFAKYVYPAFRSSPSISTPCLPPVISLPVRQSLHAVGVEVEYENILRDVS